VPRDVCCQQSAAVGARVLPGTEHRGRHAPGQLLLPLRLPIIVLPDGNVPRRSGEMDRGSLFERTLLSFQGTEGVNCTFSPYFQIDNSARYSHHYRRQCCLKLLARHTDEVPDKRNTRSTC
jgi:hypothetical protein